MSADEPFISLQNVRKVYRSKGAEFLAVSDVTMDVREGELVSLVGPSGCGKTTVLKILAGLHDADGGTIKIGNSKTPFDPARDIGMVFQQALLLKWRTILDNVLLPAEIVGLPMKAARARARDLLNLVGLAGYEDKYPQQLSGGMQQRTAIARAFIHDPKLILMDEPFGALDALTREQMNLEMLRIWRESGKTILFVTHSIQEAVFLASHCAVLTAGPARMAEYFPIELPFPRDLPIKTTDEFGAYARRIYANLREPGIEPKRLSPLFVRHGSGIAIGPATLLRQRNLGLDPHLMPGRGAEFDHLQPPAEQFDAVGRLRALIAAVEDAGGKDVGAVMLADGDVFRPQRDAHLFVRAERVQQGHLAPPPLAEIDQCRTRRCATPACRRVRWSRR